MKKSPETMDDQTDRDEQEFRNWKTELNQNELTSAQIGYLVSGRAKAATPEDRELTMKILGNQEISDMIQRIGSEILQEVQPF